jgi:hypothetical protein
MIRKDCCLLLPAVLNMGVISCMDISPHACYFLAARLKIRVYKSCLPCQ